MYLINRIAGTLFALALVIYPSDVIINEIAWMGTETSANDEWIVVIKHLVYS